MACQTLDPTNLMFLPQELFNQIYALVFTAPLETRDLNAVAQVRQDYNLLHIDHASRTLFAKTYYEAVFELSAGPDGDELMTWLRMLPHGHRNLLRKVVAKLDLWASDFRDLKVFGMSGRDMGGLNVRTIKFRVRMEMGGGIGGKVYTRVGARVESF